ncbi:hypothetical protein DL765_002912 [Monosporascus sp. GIB2]|nr:hypothetical protein DL765_002912 [Monosporascus sp. GIB2]
MSPGAQTVSGEAVSGLETTGPPSSPEKSGLSTDNGTMANRDDHQKEEYPEGLRLVVILVAVFLNIFLAALDLGIVATAIPVITDEFHQLNHVGKWYGSVYFLTIGVFSPFWSRLYKYCQTIKVLVITVAIFLVGSLVAATAPNSTTLIVGRAIQGWGGAGILGGGFLLMHQIAKPVSRPTFTGMLLAVFSCSAILGPIIGGAFTTGVTWRWCFYINLPIGGLSIALILAFFRAPKHVKPVPATIGEIILQLDFPGMFSLGASLVCFTLALQWGGLTMPWNSGPVIATLVLWIVLTIVFVIIEIVSGDYAMVPRRLIKRRETWANSLYGFILNDANWVFLYYLPIYFQSIHRMEAIQSGVANFPLLALFAVGSLVGGSGVGRIRHVQPIGAAAALLVTTGAALLYTLDETSPRSRYMGYQVIFGLGGGIGNQLPMTAIQGLSSSDDLTSNTGICLLDIFKSDDPRIAWVRSRH